MACCSNNVHICLIVFSLSLFWILFVMEVLDMAFPKYVRIYLFVKPIASSNSLELLCMIAWILKLSRISIYLSMAFNSYPLPYAYFGVKLVFNIISIYHREISPYTPCPWQVILIIVVEFVDHLHFWLLLWIAFFIAKDLVWSKSSCHPCIFWILVALLKIYFVLSCVGKSNDPILVHWHSKVILLDNALFFGELSYFE